MAQHALPAVEYRRACEETIAWETMRARMRRVPAFVRGIVVRAVESSCRKQGIERVTVDELERIRSRMPAPKMFSREKETP